MCSPFVQCTFLCFEEPASVLTPTHSCLMREPLESGTDPVYGPHNGDSHDLPLSLRRLTVCVCVVGLPCLCCVIGNKDVFGNNCLHVPLTAVCVVKVLQAGQ